MIGQSKICLAAQTIFPFFLNLTKDLLCLVPLPEAVVDAGEVLKVTFSTSAKSRVSCSATQGKYYLNHIFPHTYSSYHLKRVGSSS